MGRLAVGAFAPNASAGRIVRADARTQQAAAPAGRTPSHT